MNGFATLVQMINLEELQIFQIDLHVENVERIDPISFLLKNRRRRKLLLNQVIGYVSNAMIINLGITNSVESVIHLNPLGMAEMVQNASYVLKRKRTLDFFMDWKCMFVVAENVQTD
jgi:hypothetical protein